MKTLERGDLGKENLNRPKGGKKNPKAKKLAKRGATPRQDTPKRFTKKQKENMGVTRCSPGREKRGRVSRKKMLPSRERHSGCTPGAKRSWSIKKTQEGVVNGLSRGAHLTGTWGGGGLRNTGALWGIDSDKRFARKIWG